MTTIAISHAGGKKDIEIITHLKRLFKGSRHHLEYTEYQDHQVKEIIFYRTLKQYAEKMFPIIVIISLELFELIWVTSYKTEIIEILTNYPKNTCLHIWTDDLSVRTIRRYSSALTAETVSFRKIFAADLYIQKDEYVDEIYVKIRDPGKDVISTSNNLSVENAAPITELSNKFQKSKLGDVASFRKQENIRTMFTMGNEPSHHYKEMARWMTTPGHTVNDIQRDGAGPAKKKKKKKKSGASSQHNSLESESSLRFRDLPFGTRLGISSRLDKNDDWKSLCILFEYSKLDITTLGKLKHNDSSPSEALLYKLQTQFPQLTIDTFMQKLKDINRNDIIEYMNGRSPHPNKI